MRRRGRESTNEWSARSPNPCRCVQWWSSPAWHAVRFCRGRHRRSYTSQGRPRVNSVVHRILLVAALGAAGCDGPGHVQYDGGRCLNDGRPMTSAEVEAEQAAVAQRIASRQPWFAFITIGVVLVAAASNAERALLL